MRGIVWLTLLFGAAVVAALTLGRNDGLVSLFWAGWRVDLSLNLFLVLVLGASLLLMLALHAAWRLIALPKRARAWRLSQRDHGAQKLLRDALAFLWGGRYARAQRAIERLIHLQNSAPELRADPDALALAHLLAAEAAHRLQDRGTRQAQLEAALRFAVASELQDAARLQAAAWALDDRDGPAALAALAELPPGASRRTQGLRLRLQGARLASQPLEALRAARLLAKHQGFAPGVAQSLVRSLALELLNGARDADQLRSAWAQLDAGERRNPFTAARAAERFADMGAAADARHILRPHWDEIGKRSAEEVEALAQALLHSLVGLSADWLGRIEAAQQALPRDPYVPLVAAQALAELRLWGKAQQALKAAASDVRLPTAWRRRCWLRLAEMAKRDGDDATWQAALLNAAQLS